MDSWHRKRPRSRCHSGTWANPPIAAASLGLASRSNSGVCSLANLPSGYCLGGADIIIRTEMEKPSSFGAQGENLGLSQRQLEVLQLVSEGLTSKEIGRHLSISPSTVDNHIKAAIDKLGAKGRYAAAHQVAITMPSRGQEEASTESDEQPFSLWRLPPLGGRINDLTIRQRFYHILQLATLSTIVVATVILAIAGLVHVLSA